MVVAIGAIAYYFAVISDLSLVALLLLSYGFIAQLFPALLATFFWPRATPPGVLAGLLGGCAVVVAWNVWPTLQWYGIHPGIWGLALNFVLFAVVSLATKSMDEEHVRRFVVQ